MEKPPLHKPLLFQSGTELMDTTLGEGVTDAVMASSGDWVKAIANHRMPSRHTKGHISR